MNTHPQQDTCSRGDPSGPGGPGGPSLLLDITLQASCAYLINTFK